MLKRFSSAIATHLRNQQRFSVAIMSTAIESDAKSDADATQQRYKMTNVDGEFTAQELLQLMIDKDDRFFKARTKLSLLT